MSRTTKRDLLVIVLLLAGLGPAFSYPVNTWKHARRAHFTVSYCEETAHLVGQALAIAEETAAALAGWFGYEFSGRRISIVLADQVDEPNGWASGRDPLVFIDCRQAPSLFRGGTDWLRTVLTHELSHVYSLRVLNPPVVVGVYAGATSTAEGFDVAASETFGLNALPMWFIEGMAQLGSWRLQADSRDPLREMLLRDALLTGRLLGPAEMARFEGTSRDYELAYNQGFSLLLHLQERYWEAKLRGLCWRVGRIGLEQALQAAYGKSLAALYGEWRDGLEERWGGGTPWGGGEPLFDRRGPMVVELATARCGEYVLANWGNDYNRFSLFRRGPDGRYREAARDCGQVLKEDRVTGEVWFNRLVYDPALGTETYDLFRIGADGRIERITRGSRAFAFDALGGVLVYARYRPRQTELVRREPDGKEAVLCPLPAGHSAYSVSLVSRDLVLLSVGSAEGTRLMLLATGGAADGVGGLPGGGPLRLWPGEEVLDPVFAGGSRLVFASCRDGTPQLYWADPREDAGTWYQITGVQGGARFPSLDGQAGAQRLVCAVYEEGASRLHALQDPFSRDHPVQAGGLEAEIAVPASLPGPAGTSAAMAPASLRAPANPVWSLPTLHVGVSRSGGASDASWSGTAGVSASVYNAPENAGLDASLQFTTLLFADVSLPPATGLELSGWFALGAFRNTLAYSLYTSVYYLAPGIDEIIYQNSILLESDYQLTARQALAGYFRHTWEVDTATGYASLTTLTINTLGLNWLSSDSPRSAFDPAGLGQPLRRISAWAELIYDTFPDTAAYYGRESLLAGRLRARMDLCALSPESRLSAGLRLEGFTALGGLLAGGRTPGLSSYLGGSSRFSGYPEYYAWANHLALGVLELAANPFVERAGPTRWYERARLGLRLEAGTGGERIDESLFLSAEAGLYWSFYLWANRESTVYLRYALPLTDPAGTQPGPRVYAGFSQ